MLDLNLPKPYQNRIRNALNASADTVNLRNLGGGGGSFFAGGARLSDLYVAEFALFYFHFHRASRDVQQRKAFRTNESFSIEDPVLVKILYESFRSRLIAVMDQSQHLLADSGGESAAYEFCQALDTWERECTFSISIE